MATSQLRPSVSKNDALIAHIVKQLCIKVTGLNNDSILPYFDNALVRLGSNAHTSDTTDELEVVKKIKKKLVREKDAALFSELHRRLCSQTLLKNRGPVLNLLYHLRDTHQTASVRSHYAGMSFTNGLSANFISTPSASLSVRGGATSSGSESTLQSSGQTSGFSSISTSRTDPSRTLVPSAAQTPLVEPVLHPAAERSLPSVAARLVGPVASGERSADVRRGGRVVTEHSLNDNSSCELTEATIVKEVIFAFQGIAGHYIHYDAASETFAIDPKAGVPNSVRQTVSKLVECGFLFSRVRKFVDLHGADRASGLVVQSFCAALQQELTEYYRLIAVLEAQLQQEEDQNHGVVVGRSSSGLTLRRLNVWMFEPRDRLKTLACLVDVCSEKKGGQLASTVHSYTQHGDPAICRLVQHTLAVVVQPLFTTILRWIYEGELEDTYHEFFVAFDPQVPDDRLWHDKYSLRTEMVPSFLSLEQAKKILLAGKAINFLRQVCQDRTLVRSREAVRAAERSQVESMFMQDDGVFDKMIDTVYKETSQHLLHVLHVNYKFMDHLKAMRRYLLLGQGDFIRHLMDLLQEDLAKPAQTLFLHNLTGILETAIRATNAQYDDTDILRRLDVRLLEVSPGDTGWDVFSLDYHVSGHIRTVFTTECMLMYLRVFNFLWRAKRMEYILAVIWKEQMANAKLLRSVPELNPALLQCQLIVSEMQHFVQQIQYYINFEVLECSWDELLCRVKNAEDLDHIIAAHQQFLDAITTRSLLDSQSHEILTQLRTIFDLIINFQTIHDNMYCAAKDELEARQKYENSKLTSEDRGEWGVRYESEEEAEQHRRSEFCQTVLSSSRSQLRILQQSYQNMVQQFLTMLTSHSDASLRFLSFRLDFNEHYHSLLAAAKSRTHNRSRTHHRASTKP